MTTTKITQTTHFEVAFWYPGGSWGRKVCKGENAYERFVEKLIDSGAEFRLVARVPMY